MKNSFSRVYDIFRARTKIGFVFALKFAFAGVPMNFPYYLAYC